MEGKILKILGKKALIGKIAKLLLKVKRPVQRSSRLREEGRMKGWEVGTRTKVEEGFQLLRLPKSQEYPRNV